MRILKCYGKKIVRKELKACYKFFINEVNDNTKSEGYGLIRDKTILADNISSIASVGYGLAALVIGVKHKWISYKSAYNKAVGTLDTFINNVEGINGFFYHFVNMENGKREWDCEVSIIDTAIFICGALTAGEYFGKDVKKKAEILYKKINWQWYRNEKNNYFYMGYKPEIGFWGHWDMYAEQLMLYVLGVSSPTFPIDKSMYYTFQRKKADYCDIKDIIYTYCGTLFPYQFSHAWIDFRNLKDENQTDWFENSIKATKANRQYCINNMNNFKTYNENSWGLTSCLSPRGYCEFGAKPSDANLNKMNDGTVSPCGAIGSIIFTPNESIKAMEYYYNNFPKLWGKYGFKDGYNLEKKSPWFAEEYIGIDKGIELLMLENYLNGTVWRYFMKNKYVGAGLDILKIKKIESTEKENESISKKLKDTGV